VDVASSLPFQSVSKETGRFLRVDVESLSLTSQESGAAGIELKGIEDISSSVFGFHQCLKMVCISPNLWQFSENDGLTAGFRGTRASFFLL